MSNLNLNEVYDKKIADRVANSVAEKHNFNPPKFIGAGDFGVAYDIGNDMVLKVTSDKSEAIENLKLIGKDLKYIAKPYSVFSVKSSSGIPETYVIILEKLRTDHGKTGRQMIRLDYVFKDIFNVEFPDVVDHYIYGYDIGVNKESIENYLSKNPEDEKFFNNIIHIGEEALRNGIASMDYLNFNNLGYKKNGNLGFYDVGFGDLYSVPAEKPQEVEIDEDGGDSLNEGAYDKPVYHLTTAENAKAIEREGFDLSKARETQKYYIHFSHDPHSMNIKGRAGHDTIVTAKLDLHNPAPNKEFREFNEFLFNKYDPNSTRLKDHSWFWKEDFAKLQKERYNWFMKNGYDSLIQPNDTWVLDPDAITVLAVNHNTELEEDLEYNHVVGDATKDTYRLSEERRKAWVDGAKSVEVKKKCRLAGLGNTSAACNQGDISNLIFKPLNEADIMSLQDLPFKDEIEQLGGEIYSVGGKVRDEFIGKESKDLDILITGIPMDNLEDILSKYGRVDSVGESFGILKFKPEGATEEIDVAIPRTEVSTGEGGHKGFEVTSDHTLPIEADLFRRDFTINAIAKDINGEIIDPYDGQKDLKNKIIRVVNPKAFSEDPLRMLRAIQFSSRFGFTIEPETLKLIKDNAHKIKEIAPERILIEFDKIVKKGDTYTGAFNLKNTGLFKNIFGQDAPLYVGDKWDNVETMGEFIYLLSHHALNSPSDFYKDVLKGDINTYNEIRGLEFAHNDTNNHPLTNRSIAHNIYAISPNVFQSKILPDNIKSGINDLQSGKYPKNIKDLTINGNDLMNLGYKGKEIGDTLKSLLMKTYSDEILNNREDLLKFVDNNTATLNENKQSVDFYVNKYNEWNGEGGYSKPTEVSVLEFLQNNYEDYSKDEELNKKILDVLSKENISESKYGDVKKSLSLSKSIGKEMKEKISKYLGGGSTYHKGGRLHGLIKPKVKGKSFKGVGLGADKDGFYVYTHRAASKRYKSPEKISQKDIKFIESTG